MPVTETETEARRKERAQNAVPPMPYWLSGWKVWINAAIFGVVAVVIRHLNGN